MSIAKQISVICDNCRVSFPGGYEEKARVVKAKARKEGWRLGRNRDFCGSCAEKIDKAIASAKAGNIA